MLTAVQCVLHRLVPLKINPSPFVLQSLSNLPIICLIQGAEHHRTTACYTLQKARFFPKFRVMMNEFVSLFMPLVYAFLLSACAFLLLALVLIVRKRSKKGAVPIPVGASRKIAMIPKAITAPFRWWPKLTWIVFWGSIPLFYFISDPHLRFVNLLILIFSFIIGMILNWQRSKIATIVVVVFVFVGYAKIDGRNSVYRRIAYFSEIRSHLREATHAQESYFDKNNSFKSCVACTSSDLPAFHNRSKVTLNAEVGRTGFVLTATHKKCGSSVWTYQSTTEPITGPNPQDVCK